MKKISGYAKEHFQSNIETFITTIILIFRSKWLMHKDFHKNGSFAKLHLKNVEV